MAIPPGRQPFERCRGSNRVGGGSVETARLPDRRVAGEDRFRHRHEIVHARIGEALAPRLVKRKLAAEAEDVPGIDRRAAADGAEEQIGGVVEQVEGAALPGRRVAMTQALLRRHDPARDPREHPRGCRRHHARHPLGAFRTPEPREHRRERHALHLPGATAGEQRVDMTPHAAERLPQPLHLRLETPPVVFGEAGEQPAVKLVAVAGDPRQEFGERQRRLVGAGAVPGEPRCHQHDASEHRRRLAAQVRLPLGRLIEWRGGRGLWPGEDSVERCLLDDHPPVAAAVVDPRGIPEAEEIVGAARRGVQEVEGAGIDGQLLEEREVEVGLLQKRRRRGGEDLDRPGHEVAVAAVRGARPSDVERDRPDPLVRIGLREPAVFEDGHGPPADVIIELRDRLPNDLRLEFAVGASLVPRSTVGQHGLRRCHHEKRPFDRTGRLVLEQVGMKATVRREQPVEDDPEHGVSLSRIAKGRLRGLERRQPIPQDRPNPHDRISPLDDPLRRGRLERRIEIGHRPPGGRVIRPG